MSERILLATPLTIALASLFGFAPQAHAGVEDELESRWEGAWLIIDGEVSSNCNGLSTNNQVNGDLISSRGLREFPPGELGQVTDINVKRRRVDVTIALEEPVLIEYRDGPFTLYREASCKVELQMDFGDERTKDLGVDGIEAQFGSWFERYARRADAEDSAAWNERERRDYPVDYERTLAEYAAWKVEQFNSQIDARIQESADQIQRLIADVSADDEFGAGLSYGIAAMRSTLGAIRTDNGDDCAQLLASTPATFRQAHEAPAVSWANGYETGQSLAYYIELGRQLPFCYMAPDDPAFQTSFTSR